MPLPLAAKRKIRQVPEKLSLDKDQVVTSVMVSP
jgi:hypothetical protein